MIIWGSKGVTKVGGTGEFHCPVCGDARPYTHKILKRYFTLYFIPLFPMETIGEYVECTSCQGTFKTEALHFDPVQEREKREAEFNDHVKRVMILSALDGGAVGRAERKAIRELFGEVSGTTLSDYALETEVVLARNAGVTPADYARRFAGGLSAVGKEKVLKAAAIAVQADGALTPNERQRLTDLATALDITPAHLKGILSELDGDGGA